MDHNLFVTASPRFKYRVATDCQPGWIITPSAPHQGAFSSPCFSTTKFITYLLLYPCVCVSGRRWRYKHTLWRLEADIKCLPRLLSSLNLELTNCLSWLRCTLGTCLSASALGWRVYHLHGQLLPEGQGSKLSSSCWYNRQWNYTECLHLLQMGIQGRAGIKAVSMWKLSNLPLLDVKHRLLSQADILGGNGV